MPVARHVAALIDLHTGRVELEAFAVRGRSDAEQRVRPLGDPPVVARDPHSLAVTLDRLCPRPLQQADSSREELRFENRGDLRVLVRQHLLPGDDEAHLRAERAEHVRELDPGDPRADDHEVVGYLRRRVRLSGREHTLAVDRHPVGDAWA